MAEISAAIVMQLRQRTGAGMMECKKALVESEGNFDEAISILRKRGIASASKKATRVTKQGLIGKYISPDAQLGVLVEVNCESDFVARTDDFLQLTSAIGQHIAESNPRAIRNEDGAEVAQDPGHTLYGQPFFQDTSVTVEHIISTRIATLGENIAVSRFTRFHIGENADAKVGYVGAYLHPGSQLGVMVELSGSGTEFETLVHDVAMQIAAADPQFIRREDVTAADIEKEKDIHRARALAEGKPEKMVDKIIEGRMNKFYEEVCLLEQPFIKDNNLTIHQLLGKHGADVVRYTRFKVGDAHPVESAAE